MDRAGFGAAPAQWLTLSNSVAVIPPSGSADIVLAVDAASLPEGSYEGIIQIDTNDSTLAGITIPVHLQVNQSTGTGGEHAKIPGQFTLYQNYPNPFNGSTVIPYVLSGPSRVKITVIDPLGRVVSDLYSGYQESGYYQATWDGKDRTGLDAVSGIYFIQLQAGNRTLTKKCLLIR